MSKIRVLAVDDSVVFRRLLSDVLLGDPELDVVGVAEDGRIALGKIALHAPDLVVLDVEMPNMDGLEALTEIRARWPRLPVIMFSSLTHRGAAVTLEALARGANDFSTKPSAAEGPEGAVCRIREDLIPRIKAFCRGVAARGREEGAPPGPTPPRPHFAAGPAAPRIVRRPFGPIEVVVMGTSTGGPNALGEILPALPADFPLPIVIVQHMPPIFTRMLAERLAARSRLGVSEASHGEPLRPGHAYIAPGDRHLVLSRGGEGPRLLLRDEPRVGACRPSVDVLFRSAAVAFPGATLAVVLTGLGADGLEGTEAIFEGGGTVLAQDEPTSVIWEMPGAVIKAGLADWVLPLELIAGAIVSRAISSRELAAPACR